MSSYKFIFLISSLVKTAFLASYKNIALIFGLIRTAFLIFLFSVYKIVDSEYSPDNNKSLKMSIAAITENREMIIFVPDHLKTKTMCKHAVKKLPFLIRYVLDPYKTQQMRDKTILLNSGALKFVPDR